MGLISNLVQFRLCSRYKSNLSRLLDNELPPEKVTAIQTHLSECISCRQEYENLRFVTDVVAAVEIPDESPNYLRFQAQVLNRPTRVPAHVPVASTARLQLKFGLCILAALALNPLFFLLGASYMSTTDTVPPIRLTELLPTSRHLLSAPVTTQLEVNAQTKNTFSPQPPQAQILNPAQLWERFAQDQQVDLQRAPEPKRGDPVDNKLPLLIVMAKAHHTGLRLELPENCEKGKFLVSLEQMDGKKLPIMAEKESFDGSELTVSLDLRQLSAGQYQLLVERKNEERREYIGHFTVQMVDPTDKGSEK